MLLVACLVRRDPQTGLLREDVHVRRLDLEPYGFAAVRWRPAMDPGGDLLRGDQLVLGDTGQGAIDERIRAELLDDPDVRCRCLPPQPSPSSNVSGLIPRTRSFSFPALARVSRGTGTT